VSAALTEIKRNMVLLDGSHTVVIIFACFPGLALNIYASLMVSLCISVAIVCFKATLKLHTLVSRFTNPEELTRRSTRAGPVFSAAVTTPEQKTSTVILAPTIEQTSLAVTSVCS